MFLDSTLSLASLSLLCHLQNLPLSYNKLTFCTPSIKESHTSYTLIPSKKECYKRYQYIVTIDQTRHTLLFSSH